ncbi:uncharacterized protein LOC125823807 isoform X2 [Solanum verrucosum]|uniref:uncharacterized protein LOC125823807 isoform X2 n=1 Tax=Solanum verrucosum TaxID=315347 RepID=UPI0020D01E54|nr:uncharacterized protein LOC125823807 isoform X2 [Solanum verrucosum]
MGLHKSNEDLKTQLPGGTELHNSAHEDLIKEVALLELEIMYLEKYLLSMYRNTFAKRLQSLDDTTITKEMKKHNNIITEENKITNTSPCMPPVEGLGDPSLVDTSILRCHSSLSHTAVAASFKPSPLVGVLADALDSYHSLPLSMLEHAQVSTSNWTAPDHSVNGTSNHFHHAPNQLSEEMIKCISAIYFQIADPPLFSYDYPFSPISLSSSSVQQGQNDMGILQCEESSSNSTLNNPFHIKEPREFNGSFFTMTEVQGLCRDKQSLDGVDRMLQHFRYLVSKLKEVDPRKMRHDEKLAFWINVHNALVMHAFLVYGIPRSTLKRVSQLLKAAYNIGGNTVSVEMIQSSILGCRLPRPGQLRLYTPKRVFQELEVAKEEYLQTNTSVRKEQKLVLPKNVESYVKEVDLCPSGLKEMIELALPEHFTRKFQGKLWKKIEWTPHNFTFRYLISHELLESVVSF